MKPVFNTDIHLFAVSSETPHASAKAAKFKSCPTRPAVSMRKRSNRSISPMFTMNSRIEAAIYSLPQFQSRYPVDKESSGALRLRLFLLFKFGSPERQQVEYSSAACK